MRIKQNIDADTLKKYDLLPIDNEGRFAYYVPDFEDSIFRPIKYYQIVPEKDGRIHIFGGDSSNRTISLYIPDFIIKLIQDGIITT